MATIREIAKRVGFSQATVSRVLKDDPTFSVKDSTREKILNASLERTAISAHYHSAGCRDSRQCRSRRGFAGRVFRRVARSARQTC